MANAIVYNIKMSVASADNNIAYTWFNSKVISISGMFHLILEALSLLAEIKSL
ncbi:MAG: hypothetical protein HRT83_03275 [Hyphomicrobiaceae bacterium]|nr:hypothetical protein [Hyphomicrobiaceae bacterium]